jgi:hypothetical protein
MRKKKEEKLTENELNKKWDDFECIWEKKVNVSIESVAESKSKNIILNINIFNLNAKETINLNINVS